MDGQLSKAMLRKTWRFIAGKSVKLLLMDFLASNAADHKMVFHTVWARVRVAVQYLVNQC